MEVNIDWWRNFFNKIYLLTDARSVCDKNLTRQEVNCLEEILKPNKSDAILDLCGGQGRHALELSRRGFANVTVLDHSRYLVDLGSKTAQQEGLNTVFIQADARNPGLRKRCFQFIIIMASSFGYFIDEDENKKILTEAFHLLKPAGILLLDLPNSDYLVKNFKAFSTHRINNDITVNREREMGDDIIYSRETVLSEKNGQIRTRTYCTRLYSHQKISAFLSAVNFRSISCIIDFMNRGTQGDFGCMTNRMIVTAKRS